MNLEEIKARINPQYADTIGTESHERKWLCDEIESLRQQLADALDCKNGHGPTALEQYTQITKDEPEMVPIEQLRFFLSLGLNGQDWLDVEPLIEAVMQQLADSQKQVVMLRDAIDKAATQIKRCDYTPARSALLQVLDATEPKP